MITGAFELSNSGGTVLAKQGDQANAGAGGTTKGRYGETGDTGPWYLVLESQTSSARRLVSLDKSQFLQTLPSAIKQFKHVASNVSGGATMARRDWAPDILREAFRAVGSDCAAKAAILRSIIAAAPDQAAALTELAIAEAPNCAGAFGGNGAGGGGQGEGDFGPPALNNVVPLAPGFAGGGGQGNLVAICHNGHTIFVSPQGAENHLQHHPGDTLGPCQVTPVQNR
jgi:hypothetical protein